MIAVVGIKTMVDNFFIRWCLNCKEKKVFLLFDMVLERLLFCVWEIGIFFEEFCLYIHFLHLSEIISLKWHERKLEIAFAFHFHNYQDMWNFSSHSLIQFITFCGYHGVVWEDTFGW